MILRNKLTKETLNINYADFRKRFAKELQTAFDNFKKSENVKPYFKLKDYIEQDFYFNLQWNFNHFGNSVWYIERL